MEEQKNKKNSGVLSKIAIIAALCIAITMTIYMKKPEPIKSEPVASAKNEKALPRLVDLGASKCVACKAMEPVLHELKNEYKGRLRVDFIDVWKNEAEAKKYKINIIPTQILFDASGKELFRHEGFLSKDDILKKFLEFKINLKKK